VAIVRGDRTIVTDNGLLHRPLGVPKWLGDTDLAIVEFLCAIEYKVAPITAEPAAVGEPLRSAGFPAGAQVWAVVRGFVELLLSKFLPQGHSLAYTNEVKISMSGGPIFNAKGFLVRIKGRGKYRDPDFGVYAFKDATEQTAELLKKMVKSSWVIPISVYLQFVSSHLGS